MAAVKNGRLDVSALAKLPTSWSNAGRVEYLQTAAFASLSRMLLRAVPGAGVNFQVYDAYRSYDEQVAMLRRNYRRVNRRRSRSSDRTWDGSTWEKRAGRPVTASPGHSNHGEGLSVDIHPGPIQDWMKRNAGRFGWVNDVPSEAWHWTYLRPGSDRYRDQGVPDVRAIQRAVGVEVDGKFGTGTSAAVREYQRKQGLTVDGIPGPDTVAALLGSTAAAVVPVVEPETGRVGKWYERSAWPAFAELGARVHPFETEVHTIYLHYPAAGWQNIGAISADDAMDTLAGYANGHINGRGWFDFAYNVAVSQAGDIFDGRGLGNESGANGGSVSNDHGVAVLLLIGNGETPSPNMLAALDAVFGEAKRLHPGIDRIAGHQESPDANTECPGAIVMGMIRSGAISLDGNDAAIGVQAAPAPPRVQLDEDGRLGRKTSAEIQRRLGVNVDGRLGPKSWTAVQKFVDAPYKDGKISRQSYRHHELGNGVSPNGWEYTGRRSSGSQTVQHLQAYAGVDDTDGVLFEGTTLQLQIMLNRYPAFLRDRDRVHVAPRVKAAGL